MKKNLRIASATAAALLAVAPVAASAVPANAAVNFNNQGTETPSKPTNPTKVAINVNLGNINGQDVSIITKNATVTASNNASVAKATDFGVKIYKVSTSNGNTTYTPVTSGNLDSGHYAVVVSGLILNNLTNSTKYTPEDGEFGSMSDANAWTKSDSVTGSALGNASGVSFKEDFTVNPSSDTNAVGTPYFVQKNNGTDGTEAITTGSVDLSGNTSSVDALASLLKTNFDLKVTTANTAAGETQAKANNVDFKAAAKEALTNAGVTVNADGTFTVPATNFVVNLAGSTNNGKSTTLPITVNVNPTNTSNDYDSYPQFVTYPGSTSDSAALAGTKNTISIPADGYAWAKVAVNGKVNVDGENGIKSSFKAELSKADSNTTLGLSVDTSKVNTAVAGTYPVTVSATNPQGKTSSITFNITVGKAGAAYKVAANDGTVYSFNGNTRTATSASVKKGDNVATFGDAVTINGVKYYRINEENANQFVEASVFTAPAKEESTSTTIMYKSAVYKNDNGKLAKAGKTIKGYHDADLVVDSKGNLKKYTIEGQSFYKLANENGYVRERNVTGSKMTLKKNAYVYKSNGRRANRKLLKKGSTITVYGDKYKAIRHYRKEAVRIGHNKYVKLPNVKYSKDLLVK